MTQRVIDKIGDIADQLREQAWEAEKLGQILQMMRAGKPESDLVDETQQTLDQLPEDPAGQIHELSNADMGFTYRHCGVPDDWIFTEATYAGEPGDPEKILSEMNEVAEYRAKNQPIKERTGGSTFKNPPGSSAWKLVDAAGMRGFRVGGAKVSEMHCNFLINDADASAEDVERLGETVRARVRASQGVTLDWEIIRIGEPLPGHATGEALALETAI